MFPGGRCPSLHPSFELLNPAGDNFPVGWNAPLATIIDKDAHWGAIALRMAAEPGEVGPPKSAPERSGAKRRDTTTGRYAWA